MPDQLPQRRHIRGELALQRRHSLAIGGGAAQPDAAQLREFLLQGHPGQQVADPLGHRAGRVLPRGRGERPPVRGVSRDEAAPVTSGMTASRSAGSLGVPRSECCPVGPAGRIVMISYLGLPADSRTTSSVVSSTRWLRSGTPSIRSPSISAATRPMSASG